MKLFFLSFCFLLLLLVFFCCSFVLFCFVLFCFVVEGKFPLLHHMLLTELLTIEYILLFCSDLIWRALYSSVDEDVVHGCIFGLHV